MKLDELAHTCVVGMQWGDEGKGKIVDLLMAHHDVVVRYGGGANAGHTVVVGEDKFALHQIPSGIIRPEVTCVLANGMVIDPAILLGEMQAVDQRGVSVAGRLWISDRAHVVLPYHRREDALAEKAADKQHKLGTTARGIGPCYADKVLRYHGIRVGDMLDADRFRDKVARAVAHKNAYFAAVYDERTPLDANAITDEYLSFAELLRPHVCDTAQLISERLDGKSRILFEGAQGCMLDIDHGTYPYVTSSAPGVGGVVGGAGVSPRAVKSIVAVVKAYTTRVGDGPFPTELSDATGDTIRERGNEFGTTTGRPRRCGWFDCVAARYAAMLAGPTHLAVLHMDTLSGMGELRLCVGYRWAGRSLKSYPANVYEFADVEPVYETLPGWDEDVSGCRRFADLPTAARNYLNAIAERVGAPVLIVGVGSAREQTIIVED